MQYPTRAVNWILKGGCQRVYTWRVFKAKINMWRLKKDRDSWIYDLVWGVTCPLKYKLLVNFFVHLVKSSRFSRNVLRKTRDLKFCLSYTWHVNFSKNSCMKSCQDHESHSESSLMDALCSDIHCFFRLIIQSVLPVSFLSCNPKYFSALYFWYKYLAAHRSLDR